MSLAFNYLSYKPRTEYEMKKYLGKKGFDEETIFEVIEKLKDYRYVDDTEYITSFHKSQTHSKGYGPLRIQYNLMQKGISKDKYREIESSQETDYYEIALGLAEKRLKEKRDLESLKKIYGFLLRRGFPMEVVSKVISKLREEE